MPAGAATLRLMACAEAFSREEDGALGRDDWPALVQILQRELEIVTGLAQASSTEATDANLQTRAEALGRHLGQLDQRIDAARSRARAELDEINATSRRLRAVRGSYARRPDDATASRFEAA